MKLVNAAVAVLAAVVTGVGGGAGAAQLANAHDRTGAQSPPSTAARTSSQTPTAQKPTATAKPSPSPPRKPLDALSEDNVVRERLYYDVTGHSFTRVTPDPAQTMSACTGDTKFADVLPRKGMQKIGSKLVGDEEGLHAIEEVAQTRSAKEARATADLIASLVETCADIQGGDFGYGAPVTTELKSGRKVVYLPAYDSDTVAGAYIVFAVGNRVGFVDAIDDLSKAEVVSLAREAANIAAD